MYVSQETNNVDYALEVIKEKFDDKHPDKDNVSMLIKIIMNMLIKVQL